MRIALLSDIHGNSIALDAVLTDIQSQGNINEYWLLGDYCAIGSDPAGVLERISNLPRARFIRGNTDRYIVANQESDPHPANVAVGPGQIEKLIEVQRSFAWTQGAVTITGWFDWLTRLPVEIRITLPNGTRVLLVHASPGQDDGDGIYPTHTEAELKNILNGCNADVVCVGHNHWVVDRTVNGVRVLNPGSISNPLPPDLRASYMLIEANEVGYQVQVRRVEYDRDAAIDQVRQIRHPAADYITRFLRGQITWPWLRQ